MTFVLLAATLSAAPVGQADVAAGALLCTLDRAKADIVSETVYADQLEKAGKADARHRRRVRARAAAIDTYRKHLMAALPFSPLPCSHPEVMRVARCLHPLYTANDELAVMRDDVAEGCADLAPYERAVAAFVGKIPPP